MTNILAETDDILECCTSRQVTFHVIRMLFLIQSDCADAQAQSGKIVRKVKKIGTLALFDTLFHIKTGQKLCEASIESFLMTSSIALFADLLLRVSLPK